MPGSKYSEYELEHSKYLKQKSDRAMPIPDENLMIRRDLVFWMITKSNELNLPARVIQLSVAYFDSCLPELSTECDYSLIAGASISLSNLYENQREFTAWEEDILTGSRYTHSNLIQVRNRLLCALSFKLDLCTASEIISFFTEHHGVEYQFYFERAEKLSELCYLNSDICNDGPVVIATVACFHTFFVLGLRDIALNIQSFAVEVLGANSDHIDKGIDILNAFLLRSQASINFHPPSLPN